MAITKASILVVDDDETFRERIARALQRRGYVAREADNAGNARELAGVEESVFDAAVVDLKMPGESGLELVRWLGLHHPDMQVLVLTGYGSIATAVEAIRLGAADYLTKPADADQILQALFSGREGVPEEGQEADLSRSNEVTVPSLDRVEWEHLQRVLSECHGNISAAARVLGIERRTLQRKLQKLPPGQ